MAHDLYCLFAKKSAGLFLTGNGRDGLGDTLVERTKHWSWMWIPTLVFIATMLCATGALAECNQFTPGAEWMPEKRDKKKGFWACPDLKPPRPYVKDCSPECDQVLVPERPGVKLRMPKPPARPSAGPCPPNHVLSQTGRYCVAIGGQCRPGHAVSPVTGRCVPGCRPGHVLSPATGRCVSGCGPRHVLSRAGQCVPR